MAHTSRVCLSLIAALVPLVGLAAEPELPVGMWTKEQASAWERTQPWLVGCNFLPSTAVNDVEMWRKETFDPTTIDRELGWARSLGFNSVRVFLNYVVWEADADGLKERFARFLEIAAKHGISAMPVLLDDCNFAGREAKAAPQPDPIPGVHNSQWVSSPPLRMVADQATWPKIEQYVKGMVGAFGEDRRVVVWDLYNEPANSAMGDKSLPLVAAAFAWARETKPTQPLTVGVWADFHSPMSQRMFALSDVVSFHGYDAPNGLEAKTKLCAAYGRPVLCTEWLRRQGGNDFESLLPIFEQHRVGCYNWGLVAGRTQTYFPWGSPKDAPEPKQWQHDIFRRDGTPFSESEVRFTKSFFGRSPSASREVVPTARKEAVAWRYTLDDPGEGWAKPDFNDSGWKQGPAPFGRHEPPIARAPRTEWTTKDIWLRREFTWPEGRFEHPRLVMHYDEEPEVFWNGVPAAQPGGYTAGYRDVDLSPEARATLKPGRNTLAVHCRQTVGGQFIDVGIAVQELPADATANVPGRWPVERAWQWSDAQPWPCGFNYVPANAISYTEMWMDYAFDAALIDREMKLAETIGFNCCRVVLPFVVWEAEPAAFRKRLDTFLGICHRRGIRVMFALFDDCDFGPIRDPVFGKQPEVVVGWYANGWTPSPGHSMVRDSKTWPRLEKYVKDVIATFKDDPRVWVWDLYNEPTNGGLGEVSLPLVENVFRWARDVNPAQPLTVGQWHDNAKLNALLHRHSDVVTFHDYGKADGLARHIRDLQRHGRPVIGTEWLNRGNGSTVAECLPVFRRNSVGAMHWGLVNGKTQTHLNWGHRPGQPDPPVWQHDLYRPDHTAYRAEEIEFFRAVIGTRGQESWK